MAEAPARNPNANQPSERLTARKVSISRGESGTTGAVREQNLQAWSGGQVSPAERASDSARRPTPQAIPAPPSLTSSQPAQQRRSKAEADAPTTLFRATTDAAATLAGSTQTGERTLQASASASLASAPADRGEVAVDRGSATVDQGPTKVVAGSNLERRSGGGQPELGALQSESQASRSRSDHDQRPTLSANPGMETVAELEPTAASPASEIAEPNAESLVQAREGGDQPSSLQSGAASLTGNSSPSEASLGPLESSRQRAERLADSGGGEPANPQPMTTQGNQRSGSSQAPSLATEVQLGVAARVATAPQAGTAGERSETGSANTVTRNEGFDSGSHRADRPATTRGEGVAQATPSAQRRERATLAATTSRPSTMRQRGNGQGEGPSPAGRFSNPLVENSPGVEGRRTGASQSPALEASNAQAERQSGVAGARLEIQAAEGPAGFGTTPASSLGVRTRPASRESEFISPVAPQRFRRDSGGAPSVDSAAVVAKEAFLRRGQRSLGNAEPSTEAAIQAGLEFLVRVQHDDGHWSLEGFDQEHPVQANRQLQSDSAATGLALLAFQGAGYTHREFKYAEQVQRGLNALIQQQAADGCLFRPAGTRSDDSCRMYSHAIATLALCEAYGMTQDPALREPTQRALNWIQVTQDPRHGGWRYFADPARRSTDTSVTGWMLMALQSARLAGLEVEQETLVRIDQWLDLAADPSRPSQYLYNPFATDSSDRDRSSGRRSTPSMTAVGLLMRIYSGWRPEDPALRDGAASLLAAQLPGDGDSVLRDTYYWYYATQVLKHVDGEPWETWNDALHPLLVKSQEKSGPMAGSWHPYEPVPDRWGIHAGRLYVTTMNLLSLEVRYRLLPLYEETLR